jgi:hypothetical protein
VQALESKYFSALKSAIFAAAPQRFERSHLRRDSFFRMINPSYTRSQEKKRRMPQSLFDSPKWQ